MGVVEIIALIAEGTKALATAREAYNQIKDTLAETDAQKVHEALLKAQAETEALRPQVDAALDAASKR
jgi:hypothetical protein